MTALICTVGTTVSAESDIVEVLAEEVRTSAPQFVYFIVSNDSRENAEKIVLGAELRHGSFEFITLTSPHDLNEVFERTNEAIRTLMLRGFDHTQITVNYTGGTKVMGSGAVLSAVFHQCEQLRYIYEAGENRNQIVTTHPRAVSAYRDLLLACRLIEEMRFPSALNLLEHIDPSLLSLHDMEMLEALRSTARAYYYWDNFRYGEVATALGAIKGRHDIMKRFSLHSNVLNILNQMAGELEKGKYSPYILAEMINNARRRRKGGKLDDSVSRVYRALEMLAQWVLHDSQIDTNDLDTRRVPPRFRVNYEAMRSMEDGLVRIGMRKSFELLALLEAPIGLAFEKSTPLQELLQRRGLSILAHGTHTISEEDCDDLLAATMELLRIAIRDIDSLCDTLQFPWLARNSDSEGCIP